MDKRTEEILQRISREATRGKQLTRVEETGHEEHEQAERALRDKRLPAVEKWKIQKLVDGRSFIKRREVTNENVIREVDRETTQRVRAALERGEIKPAEKDDFIRRQEERMK